MIQECTSGNLRTLILSNGILSVKILAGKGGDINQITYLPGQMTLLHTEDSNFSAYKNRDLCIVGLSRYSDDSTGGWQDVVPGYGRYGKMVLQDYPVGIAATVPWEVCEYAPSDLALILSVHLPRFPLFLEKQIRLEGGTLVLKERIRNEGNEQAAFTWTQHSVFGGDFLDGEVSITYPGDTVFLSSLFAGQGGKKEAFYENISRMPMPDGTRFDLTRMREPGEDGQLIFTMEAKKGNFSLYHGGKDIGFQVDWDKDIFPYIRCWYQNTDKGYSYAIEPCNYAYSSFGDTDKDNMYLHLGPGEEISTEIQLSVIHKNKD